jgi:5'-3' exonuclease
VGRLGPDRLHECIVLTATPRSSTSAINSGDTVRDMTTRADPDRLLLLDTPSLYFRAFHGVPSSVTAPDGSPVNAIRGTIDVLARQIRDLRPRRVVACFDYDWRPAWRVALLPSYKLHRVGEDGGDQTPDELGPQVPVIEEVLDALGIARLGADEFEADDVIGTLCARHPGPVDILTGDRDLFQLVRDDRPVRVIYTVEKFRPVDEARVTEKYGIPGRTYGDFAVLRGDPSDGLPGVAGIGAKTAAALIERFGTVEEMVRAIDEGVTDGFPAGARNKLVAAHEYLTVAAPVVRVRDDVPLPEIDDLLPLEPRDPDALVRLSERWGLDSPLNRLLTTLRELR